MDLSKIPDLEIRQKAKGPSDEVDAIDKQIETVRADYYAKMDAEVKPLYERRAKLDEQIAAIIGKDREIVGTCAKTGLPIFDGDETEELLVLAEAA
jgi:hypothetical protein